MKIGDKVVMNGNYYVSEVNRGRVWTVCSEPWNLCGTMVVLLEGKSGGYAVDGLDLVQEASTIDPVAHGEYTHISKYGTKRCSVFGTVFSESLIVGYCPKCGAKMDLEEL